MHAYFRNFILNLMFHIVKIKDHIHFDNPVMILIQLLQLFGNVIDQFFVSIKVKRLNMYDHRIGFICEKIIQRASYGRNMKILTQHFETKEKGKKIPDFCQIFQAFG